MNRTLLAAALVLAASISGVAQSSAQTRPHHSGHMSFNAPQMRTHGSGLHHPNRPSHHHFPGHAGYRPVHEM